MNSRMPSTAPANGWSSLQPSLNHHPHQLYTRGARRPQALVSQQAPQEMTTEEESLFVHSFMDWISSKDPAAAYAIRICSDRRSMENFLNHAVSGDEERENSVIHFKNGAATARACLDEYKWYFQRLKDFVEAQQSVLDRAMPEAVDNVRMTLDELLALQQHTKPKVLSQQYLKRKLIKDDIQLHTVTSNRLAESMHLGTFQDIQELDKSEKLEVICFLSANSVCRVDAVKESINFARSIDAVDDEFPMDRILGETGDNEDTLDVFIAIYLGKLPDWARCFRFIRRSDTDSCQGCWLENTIAIVHDIKAFPNTNMQRLAAASIGFEPFSTVTSDQAEAWFNQEGLAPSLQASAPRHHQQGRTSSLQAAVASLRYGDSITSLQVAAAAANPQQPGLTGGQGAQPQPTVQYGMQPEPDTMSSHQVPEQVLSDNAVTSGDERSQPALAATRTVRFGGTTVQLPVISGGMPAASNRESNNQDNDSSSQISS